ncbi:single-stranded DNA-binding protein [Candidatus Proelusimicrobium excrementi]|uniref:single-stranded DNA-binding protein n=1 Tax=Candidatus Proelusimicrobium excrementi TaxID=3416222 RepID=UPI003CA019C4|nr:single-stranded DNA-binding protein [Elusimicrobiaceae bacterium]MBR3927705.1 single-stranded DNA-binding protein [Clostridia bacterium]
MNKAILIGNLTRDPEMRKTASGISACTFTLAVNRPFANAAGVRDADFINVVAWRKTAENCVRFLERGSKAAVIGEIRTRSYDAQDGSKRYVTEVVADEVEFLTVKASAEKGAGNAAEVLEMPKGYEEEDLSDELPF